MNDRIWSGHIFGPDNACKRCGMSLNALIQRPGYCANALAYMAPGANKDALWADEQRSWASPDGVIVTGPTS